MAADPGVDFAVMCDSGAPGVFGGGEKVVFAALQFGIEFAVESRTERL
jgi:hypothetical protein